MGCEGNANDESEFGTCIVCGNSFLKSRSNQICCSTKCAKHRQNEATKNYLRRKREEKARQEMSEPKTCVVCGCKFYFPRPKKYCTTKCYKASRRDYFKEKGAQYRTPSLSSSSLNEDFFEDERERRKKRPKGKSLAEISKEAIEHNMDYGTYVAYLERK